MIVGQVIFLCSDVIESLADQYQGRLWKTVVPQQPHPREVPHPKCPLAVRLVIGAPVCAECAKLLRQMG